MWVIEWFPEAVLPKKKVRTSTNKYDGVDQILRPVRELAPGRPGPTDA